MTAPQEPGDPYAGAHAPYGQPVPYYYYPPAPPTNGLAIAAMVVSIVSIMSCPCPVGIVGALMGHSARRQIRERGESGEGLATAGIIMGWISTGLSVLVILGYVVLFVVLGITGELDQPSSTY